MKSCPGKHHFQKSDLYEFMLVVMAETIWESFPKQLKVTILAFKMIVYGKIQFDFRNSYMFFS